jgi:hypothetical protein
VTDDIVLRVVPRRSLLVSALVSTLVVLLPVSALLYWFAIQHGWAILVVGGQILVALAALLLLLRQLKVDTVVTKTELRGRGIFSPLVRVQLDRIHSIDIVPTYVGQAPEPVWQLLVRDAEGRRLYRMRGNFWPPGDLRRVADALPAPTTVATEPMTVTEFFAAYPGSAYWFEGRPWLVVAILTVVTAAAIGAVIWLMQLLGMQIMG